MNRTLPVWLLIVSRAAAALLGGYAFSYATTACLARLLPLSAVDAAIVASLPSFAFYTGAFIWAFATRSARRAWLPAVLAGPLAVIGFWPHLWSL